MMRKKQQQVAPVDPVRSCDSRFSSLVQESVAEPMPLAHGSRIVHLTPCVPLVTAQVEQSVAFVEQSQQLAAILRSAHTGGHNGRAHD